MRTTLLLACAAIMLGGCAAVSSTQVHNSAGIKPPDAFAEKMVRDYLAKSLKDPDSLKQFEVTRIYLKRYPRGWINGGGFNEGWLVCYQYNAKNSYGAYVGLERRGMMLIEFVSSWVEVPGLWGPLTGDCQ